MIWKFKDFYTMNCWWSEMDEWVNEKQIVLILKVSFANYLAACNTVKINYSLYMSSVPKFYTTHTLQSVMCVQGRIRLGGGSTTWSHDGCWRRTSQNLTLLSALTVTFCQTDELTQSALTGTWSEEYAPPPAGSQQELRPRIISPSCIIKRHLRSCSGLDGPQHWTNSF